MRVCICLLNGNSKDGFTLSETYPLAPHGVYWTVNGEGAHTGQPMVFLRLAGCSVGCLECDTDYSVAERVTVDTLVERVRSAAPERFHSTKPWVWITGGEPTDHDLQPLMTALQPWRVALAESGHNGQQRYDELSWRSVSPHRRIEGLYGSEVKLIPRLGALTWSDVEDHAIWTGNFAYRWIQPLAGSSEEQDRCIKFVLRTPGVQMSSQSHLGWNIP
jgi:organic radical activating enzyme